MNWKRIIIGTILGIIVVFAAIFAYMLLTTRKHSPADTASYQGADLQVTVNYCRPYKKERVIFGTTEEDVLQPYGKYWRTGANEATEIEVNKEVLFAGESLNAGRYVLYTIPGPEIWTIGLNSELGRWGAWEVDYDKDIMQVSVPATTTSEVTEQFTIYFTEAADGADMHLVWDQTKVTVPIKVAESKAN